MPVRITVLKRLRREDVLAGVDAGCECTGDSQCPLLREGQQFVACYDRVPEGFCAGAWADLFRFVLALESGAHFPWMKQPGVVLACCNDGFRPVVFRLEREQQPGEET